MINKFLRDLDILEGNVADLISESDTAQEAKRRGWTYHGYGYWEDSSGKVVGRTIDNKLVPITQSMSSTFTDTSVGGASTKSSSTSASATTTAPAPVQKKATPKPIPISKYGQVTSFFQKMKSDAESTVRKYQQGIKDMMGLPSIQDTLKAFPAFIGHPTIPVQQMTALEMIKDPDTAGSYAYDPRTLKVRPHELVELGYIRKRLAEVGIAGVVDDCIKDPTTDLNRRNSTMWALSSISTLFHEYTHADDTLYHTHVAQMRELSRKMAQNPSLATGEELRKRWLAFKAPNTITNEFMIEHKARHTMRMLANISNSNPSIPEQQIMHLIGGYPAEMAAYNAIFDEAKTDKDALAEDMWESSSVEERFAKLESGLKTAIKVCIDTRLRDRGVDVNSLSEQDAEIYSDIQDAFDDVSKILEFASLPNAGVQEFVSKLFEYLVFENENGEINKKSVFRLRAEKPQSFDIVDDFLAVMTVYGSIRSAIVQYMANVESQAKIVAELESIYKRYPQASKDPKNPIDIDPKTAKANRLARKQLVHDFLRKRRNRLGL
jgi:hypothetical protein